MYKTIEELKAALANGEITQEQYDTLAAELEGGKQPAQNAPTEEELMKKLLESDALKDVIAKQVQSAEDRVRTQYTKQLQEKENVIKALETAKMTEEERAAHELAERERLVAEKEAEIKRISLEHHASKVVADEKYKLNAEALPFILAENETEIENRANALSKFIDKEVQKRVEAEFAKHNYNPGGTQKSTSGEKNPWSKEHWNLTEQGRLLVKDPEKAKQMAAQAGHKL